MTEQTESIWYVSGLQVLSKLNGNILKASTQCITKMAAMLLGYFLKGGAVQLSYVHCRHACIHVHSICLHIYGPMGCKSFDILPRYLKTWSANKTTSRTIPTLRTNAVQKAVKKDLDMKVKDLQASRDKLQAAVDAASVALAEFTHVKRR